MKKEIILATGIISCGIGLTMLFYIAFSITSPKPVVKKPLDRNSCEYYISVDGTDDVNLYTISTVDSLIAKDIPSSLIDSVINADNE